MHRCLFGLIVLSTYALCNDVEILSALLNEKSNPNASIGSYIKLYKDSNSTIYLRKALKLAYFQNKNTDEIFDLINSSPIANDSEVVKIKINCAMRKKQYKKALNLSKFLISLDKDPDNYIFLGDLEMKFKHTKDALKCYESAYNANHSDESLLKIADIYINNFKSLKDATRVLQSHERIYGCGVLACNLLIDIYKGEKNYDELINLYAEIYKRTKDKIYLDKIVNFYKNSGNLDNLVEFLISINADSKKIIDVYKQMGEYEKARDLANSTYERTNDYDYLAIVANLEYELSMPNISSSELDNVLIKFYNCLGKVSSAEYFNNFGYLLIFYNKDVKKGMSLIEKALLIEPKNPKYIQNLALGYYKNGDCILARDLLKSVKYSKLDKLLLQKIEKCKSEQLIKAQQRKQLETSLRTLEK